MNREIITAIKERMKEELLPKQMEKLEIVLHEVFQEQENKKEKKNLVKKFINVKRIEGCSKRTEEYYESTLSFYEKHINNDICSVGTEEIRNYLLQYQKINNCSNVTLDTVRRILSTFLQVAGGGGLHSQKSNEKNPQKKGSCDTEASLYRGTD